MKHFRFLRFYGILAISVSGIWFGSHQLSAQSPGVSETWQFVRFAIGEQAGNEKSSGSFIMPEVMLLMSGGYRMYYTVESPQGSAIKYAESPDGLQWTVKGTILKGASDPTDREFIIGGASVVALPDGRYRMYYRTSPKREGRTPPGYHILSAISDDGVHFTREDGVRIDIVPNDPDSLFSLAGHGRFFLNAQGTYVGIFSGNLRGERGASDLTFTTSADGLHWGNFRTLYADYHDPVVLRQNGQYILYALYLKDYVGKAVSTDGIMWPAEMEVVGFLDASGAPLQAERDIGDVGGVVTAANAIMLYTNFRFSEKASRDIAVFERKKTP